MAPVANSRNSADLAKRREEWQQLEDHRKEAEAAPANHAVANRVTPEVHQPPPVNRRILQSGATSNEHQDSRTNGDTRGAGLEASAELSTVVHGIRTAHDIELMIEELDADYNALSHQTDRDLEVPGPIQRELAQLLQVAAKKRIEGAKSLVNGLKRRLQGNYDLIETDAILAARSAIVAATQKLQALHRSNLSFWGSKRRTTVEHYGDVINISGTADTAILSFDWESSKMTLEERLTFDKLLSAFKRAAEFPIKYVEAANTLCEQLRVSTSSQWEAERDTRDFRIAASLAQAQLDLAEVRETEHEVLEYERKNLLLQLEQCYERGEERKLEIKELRESLKRSGRASASLANDAELLNRQEAGALLRLIAEFANHSAQYQEMIQTLERQEASSREAQQRLQAQIDGFGNQDALALNAEIARLQTEVAAYKVEAEQILIEIKSIPRLAGGGTHFKTAREAVLHLRGQWQKEKNAFEKYHTVVTPEVAKKDFKIGELEKSLANRKKIAERLQNALHEAQRLLDDCTKQLQESLKGQPNFEKVLQNFKDHETALKEQLAITRVNYDDVQRQLTRVGFDLQVKEDALRKCQAHELPIESLEEKIDKLNKSKAAIEKELHNTRAALYDCENKTTNAAEKQLIKEMIAARDDLQRRLDESEDNAHATQQLLGNALATIEEEETPDHRLLRKQVTELESLVAEVRTERDEAVRALDALKQKPSKAERDREARLEKFREDGTNLDQLPEEPKRERDSAEKELGRKKKAPTNCLERNAPVNGYGRGVDAGEEEGVEKDEDHIIPPPPSDSASLTPPPEKTPPPETPASAPNTVSADTPPFTPGGTKRKFAPGSRLRRETRANKRRAIEWWNDFDQRMDVQEPRSPGIGGRG